MHGSPPPLAAPIARRLSISASVAGETGLMSTVLPEDLLVEILNERLMVSSVVSVKHLVGLFSHTPNFTRTREGHRQGLTLGL